MDEDVALAPTADDNTGLAPEVRAELQSLAQDVRETISRKPGPTTPTGPMPGPWRRFGEWAAGRGLHPCRPSRQLILLHLQDLVQGRAGLRPPSGPPPAPSPRRTGRRGSVAATRRPTRT